MKTVLKIALLLLIANAAYQFGRPFYRYTKFNHDVQDLALHSKGRDDYAIVMDVMRLADQHQIAVPQEAIRIQRSVDLTHTYIDASWTEPIEFFPKWKYPWTFEVHADGWHLKPPTVPDVR